MNLQRIDPFLYLYTPLGSAECHWIQVPFGVETHIMWICFMSETKECWTFANPHVRLVDSVTGMRGIDHTPIFLSDGMLETLRPHIKRHKKSPFYKQLFGDE